MFGRLQRFYTSIKVATDVVVLALAFWARPPDVVSPGPTIRPEPPCRETPW